MGNGRQLAAFKAVGAHRVTFCWREIREKVADNLYQLTGKVKLGQVFPRFFSCDFLFCFCWKNLPSFGLAKKNFFFLFLLSRKSLKKGRFFNNYF